jgi:hypothetical protein
MGFLRDTFGIAKRTEMEPLEGTRISLANSILPAWWAENGLTSGGWIPGDATLAQRVWVANRCIQLNAQQISSMRLEWHGPDSALEPRWISSPDVSWYPNGIGDALFAIVEQYYGYGYSVQYVTDYYADGFPRTWTVLDSGALTIERDELGRRKYKIGELRLDPRRCIQIDRNPGARAHGTSALRAYAQSAFGLLAAQNQAMQVQTGGTPKFYLASKRRIGPEQASDLQEQWQEASQRRNGAPPVVPPEIEPKEMSFDPADLELLQSQEWNARVLATAFGVPSVVLNMALQGGLTYQNPLALMQMWWLTELRTTSKRIMDAFSAQLLPAGQSVTQDATDITLEGSLEADDDPQLSNVVKASPSLRPVAVVSGGQP